MEERTQARPEAHGRSGSLTSACAGCSNDVEVHLADRSVRGPSGTCGVMTYADADIAVWDCPDCGFTNADVLREP